MKYRLLKTSIYNYFVQDQESTMQQVYYSLQEHFGQSEWIIEGTNFDDVQQKLSEILQEYQMDLVLHRFRNAHLAHEIK